MNCGCISHIKVVIYSDINIRVVPISVQSLQHNRRPQGHLPYGLSLLPSRTLHHTRNPRCFGCPLVVKAALDYRLPVGVLFRLKKYRVTHLVDSNLLLTSNQKFRFGLARSGQARPIRNLSFDVNGRFESRRCVTLYLDSAMDFSSTDSICFTLLQFVVAIGTAGNDTDQERENSQKRPTSRESPNHLNSDNIRLFCRAVYRIKDKFPSEDLPRCPISYLCRLFSGTQKTFLSRICCRSVQLSKTRRNARVFPYPSLGCLALPPSNISLSPVTTDCPISTGNLPL